MASQSDVSVMVLDSFALLAILMDEAGAPEVERILDEAARGGVALHMSAINLGEVAYRVQRRYGPGAAEALLEAIRAIPLMLHEASTSLTMEAAAVKAGHSMSYADCFAVALAKRLGASVVTGDPEFRQVEPDVPIHWLPR